MPWGCVTKELPMLVNALRAPEIVVQGVAYREIIARGLLRISLFSCEQGREIIRVKLLMPVEVADFENRCTRAFLAKLAAGPAGALLM